MPERSYVLVPGDRPERFDKALATVEWRDPDLGDAVQPSASRSALGRVRVAGARSTPVWVCINPADTAWHAEDCALLASPLVRGFMVPKAQNPDDLAQLASRLREDQWLVPLLESVAGWFSAQAIARASRVLRLAFGSVDFMADWASRAKPRR